jgi:hypothetical protein
MNDPFNAALASSPERLPHFVILHRYQTSGTDCTPGEEVAGVFLLTGGQAIQLPLSLALRLLFDHLARHRLAQSAAQIAAGIKRDTFIVRHAANSGILQSRRFSRSAVRVGIDRIHRALELTFAAAGVDLLADDVLRREPTVSTEVGWRLKAAITVRHELLTDT